MESGYSTGLQNKHSISLMENKHHIKCKTFVRTSDITIDRSTITSGVSSDLKQGSKIKTYIGWTKGVKLPYAIIASYYLFVHIMDVSTSDLPYL